MFKNLNIPLMEGKKQELVIGGAPITIAGMRCAFTYRYPGAVSQPETGKPYILLTHSPASGLGDDTDLAHKGFETFLYLIDKYRPRVMAHGHVHQSYRFDFKRERQRGDTLVVNACGCYVLDLNP